MLPGAVWSGSVVSTNCLSSLFVCPVSAGNRWPLSRTKALQGVFHWKLLEWTGQRPAFLLQQRYPPLPLSIPVRQALMGSCSTTLKLSVLLGVHPPWRTI
jgi:hypothetical protein